MSMPLPDRDPRNTNATLANVYPTIEQLRSAPELAGFLRWVRKQPPSRRTRVGDRCCDGRL